MVEALRRLRREHADMAMVLLTLEAQVAVDRALACQAPAEAGIPALGRDFLETCRDHMRGEDEHFFRAALAKLTEEDWAEIDTLVGEFESPLFGEKVEADHATLRRQVLGQKPVR